jgi:hypothetical protein
LLFLQGENLVKLSISLAARTVASGILISLLGIGFLGEMPCVQAAQRPADDGTAYDFQRHYKAGESDRYKAEFVVTTNGPDTGGKDRSIKYLIVYREGVKSLTPDGTVTTVIEYDQAIASFEGKSEDYTAKMPRITHVLDSRGRGRITLEGGNSPIAGVMVQMMATADQAVSGGVPEKPVKVGETWNLNSPDPNTKLSGLAGLESAENVNGAKTLKVNYRTDASTAEITTHAGATLLVDVLTGKMIKLAFRSEGQAGQVKTTVDIQYNHVDDPDAPVSVVRRTYRVGDVDHYQFNVVMTTNDPQTGGNDRVVRYTLLVRETVKDAAPDGTTTLVDETEKAGVSADNTEIDVTAMMPIVTQIRNAQGGFQLKAEGGDAQLVSLVMPMLTQIVRAQSDVIPSKALKVGGVWNFMNSAAEDVKMNGTVSLASIESLNGAKALVLKFVADMSGSGAPILRIRDEATVWMDAQTGKTLKMNSRSASSVGANKITVEVAYTLVGGKATVAEGNGK